MKMFNMMTGASVELFFNCAFADSTRFEAGSTLWVSTESPLWAFGPVLYVVILKELPTELQEDYTVSFPYSSPAWGVNEDYGGYYPYGGGNYVKGCTALSVHMELVEGVLQVPPHVASAIRDANENEWKTILSKWFFNN